MRNPPQVGERVFWYDYNGFKQTCTVFSILHNGQVRFKERDTSIHYRALAGRIKKKERRIFWISRLPDGLGYYAVSKRPDECDYGNYIKVKECIEVKR